MAKRKLDSKTFAQQKRKRRQWLTFVRMCRYGINNFSRNAWLTIAATAVMTVTLLIIFVTVAAGNVLNDSITEMKRKIDMSIYIKTDTTEEDISIIKSELENLSNTEKVTYISPEEGLEDFAQINSSDETALDALSQATNLLPGTLRVQLVNVEDTSELENFVMNNNTYKANQDRQPTFITRKDTIATLTDWASFAQQGGIIASAVFVLISALIIFNTIRMAIFSRKDEIHMMKLIGAEKNFIRGPFIVEAIVYGFIAGVVATALGTMLVVWSKDGLASFGVITEPTFDHLMTWIGIVVLAMVILGAIIGTISSLLATRRYLRA